MSLVCYTRFQLLRTSFKTAWHHTPFLPLKNHLVCHTVCHTRFQSLQNHVVRHTRVLLLQNHLVCHLKPFDITQLFCRFKVTWYIMSLTFSVSKSCDMSYTFSVASKPCGMSHTFSVVYKSCGDVNRLVVLPSVVTTKEQLFSSCGI